MKDGPKGRTCAAPKKINYDLNICSLTNKHIVFINFVITFLRRDMSNGGHENFHAQVFVEKMRNFSDINV